MTKIKRCPFCGGRASVYVSAKYTKSRLYYIECDNYECTINPISGFYDNEDEAIEAWNTRSENTCTCETYTIEMNTLLKTDEIVDCYCSNCDSRELEFGFKYCPECGAKVVE